jgi:magnesium transporter
VLLRKKRKGKLTQKIGTPPGTLIYTGDNKDVKPRIRVFEFDEESYKEKELSSLDDWDFSPDSGTVYWVDVVGLSDSEELFRKLRDLCGIHLLVLEDVLNVNHRPKAEYFDDYIFVILKMLTYADDNGVGVESEQVSLIWGSNYVVTFQEREGDVFEGIRDRIRNNKGIVRKEKACYLAYLLIDSVVDNYFAVLEKLGERVEEFEERVIKDPSYEIVGNIHDLKRELIELRKSIWPLREVLGVLYKEDSDMTKPCAVYFRDVYDHTVEIMDIVETYREMASGLLDVFLSSLSNKMNEVMKVLTMIATIFIPLTFIAGIYGMNFKYMPELDWKWGYPLVLIVMVFISICMVLYFKRKRWL